MALIKRKILASVVYDVSCAISSCFAKKDAFQNADFSRLKCQLKRNKLTQCVCKDFQPTRKWVNKVNFSTQKPCLI